MLCKGRHIGREKSSHRANCLAAGALQFEGWREVPLILTAAAMPTSTAQQLNSKVIRSLRAGSSFDIFQPDGIAYPGNSGGPLFDPDTGEVLVS